MTVLCACAADDDAQDDATVPPLSQSTASRANASGPTTVHVPDVGGASQSTLSAAACALVKLASTSQRKQAVVRAVVEAAHQIGGATWRVARDQFLAYVVTVQHPGDRDMLCRLIQDASVALRGLSVATGKVKVEGLLQLVLPRHKYDFLSYGSTTSEESDETGMSLCRLNACHG